MKRAIQRQGSAEHPVVPEELLEFAKSKEFVRVCNESGTPCPLRAGGGGLLSLREFRRPYSYRPEALLNNEVKNDCVRIDSVCVFVEPLLVF